MDTMFTRSTPPKAAAAMSDQQDGAPAHHRGRHTLPQLDTRAPADKMPPAAPRRRPLLNSPAEPYHTPVFFFPYFSFPPYRLFSLFYYEQLLCLVPPNDLKQQHCNWQVSKKCIHPCRQKIPTEIVLGKGRLGICK